MSEHEKLGRLDTKRMAERYARHLSLPGVGADGQQRLCAARVLLVGLGGLGSPAALYLNAAGVGTLGLADFDTVDESNLQRQILYTELDVGKSKLDCAARVLQERNGDTLIILHREGIQPDNVLDIMAQYDLVLDGTDNFPTRYLLNDAAYLAGIPLISASMFQFEAQVAVFDSKHDSGCYRCLYPDMPAAGDVPNCAEAGIFGALPGMAGAMQAIEAIKWITGVGEPLQGRLLMLDTLTHRNRMMRVPANPQCALCGSSPSIVDMQADRYAAPVCAVAAVEEQPESITPDAAAKLTDALFVDVREPFELELCRIPGAVHIPLRDIPKRYAELPVERPLVMYCHKGMRSAVAAQQLREKGYRQVYNLSGGIDRWAQEMEPDMARY